MKHLSEIVSQSLQPYADAKRIYIAYSGGIDSHVLLHLCATTQLFPEKITAVHIHHGLQDAADGWVRHCAKTAEQLGVNFILQQVDAQPATGESPEEAARNSRYQALADMLDNGDLLLTGQHREDQYETILLQMLRGAGLAGLSGMPEQSPLGKGVLLRPMLNVAKQDIEQYAGKHGLHWVEDSSNQCDDFDRNYLRNQISPLLKARWPSADKTISRAGKHCAEAAEFVEEVAGGLFLSVYSPEQQCLSIPKLLAFDQYRQQLIIRRWFKVLELRMPSTQFIRQLVDNVMKARENADPCLQFGNGAVRRYRNHLYWQKQMHDIDYSARYSWPLGETEFHLPNNGILLMSTTSQPGIDATIWQGAEISISYRQGGERMRLPGRKGSHSLKKLFQEAGVPPWHRPNIPLVFVDGQLAIVGDKWFGSEFYQQVGANNIQLEWCL